MSFYFRRADCSNDSAVSNCTIYRIVSSDEVDGIGSCRHTYIHSLCQSATIVSK